MARLTKPTHLKLIEGNKGKRPLNKNEPMPNFLTDLRAPDYLPEQAKEVWNDLAPKLKQSNLLTIIDVDALSQLCVSIAQYRHATAALNFDFIAENGNSLNQMIVAQSMAFKQANALMLQFGMTPVSRSRVIVNSKEGELFGNEKTGTNYLT